MARELPPAAEGAAATDQRGGVLSSGAAAWGPAVAAVAGLAAAWIAAGSTGVLAHPLRHVLTWAALAVAVLSDRPSGPGGALRLPIVLAGAVVAVLMTASRLAPVNVLGAAALLGALALWRGRAAGRVLGTAALAICVLGIYRLANTSVAMLWIATDRAGAALGRLAGLVAGRPLWVGATFGGLDFLVGMIALYAAWLVLAPAPRLKRGLLAATAILAGHLAYLVVVACAAAALEALPKATPEAGFTWAGALRQLVPWNLPALAAAIHLAIAAAMLCWTDWGGADAPEERPGRWAPWWLAPAVGLAAVGVAAMLPVTTVLSTGRCSLEGKKVVAWEKGYLNWLRPKHGEYGRLSIGMYGMMPTYVESLGGRWLKSADLSTADLRDADVLILLYPNDPWKSGLVVKAVGRAAHGQAQVDANGQAVLYTPGPGFEGEDRFSYTICTLDDPNDTSTATVFVRVTGRAPAPTTAPAGSRSDKPVARDDRVEVARDGKARRIAVLANDAGPPGQLERIHQFVRGGGSLLLLGEHTIREEDGGSRFNDILQPTAMRVRFDSATFEVGGWLHSYEALSHPATAGIPDERNEFGVVIGASVDARWPANPLLVGRWGYADPGDEGAGASMMGNHRYDPGEKLGDLVLVAEQTYGKGRIVAFGDTSSMTNGITVGAHRFTSRLLGYLASRPGSPQAPWRQVAGMLLAAALVALLAWRFSPLRLAVAAAVLGASLAACTAATYRAAGVLPDGRPSHPNNLAYIDTTHLGAYSEESWRDDGTAGLELTLMRNGYLTLSLPELTRERLERAGLLVSVAPLREYSAEEILVVEEFVRGGGIFLCTVGYDDRLPSRELLARFGFKVGAVSADDYAEPQPLGRFKSPYLRRGDQRVYVRFHSAWPVWCSGSEPETRVLTYGRGHEKTDLPVIVLRRIGEGKVVVIGDTGFARNENLERRGGEPFDGLRENADFWRWLLQEVRRFRSEPAWLPPGLRPPETQPATPPGRGAPSPGAGASGKGVRP